MIFLFPSDGIDPVQDTSITIRIVLEEWGAQELLDWLAVKSSDYGMSMSREQSDEIAGREEDCGLGYCVVKQ
jgi:hypothetical protein